MRTTRNAMTQLTTYGWAAQRANEYMAARRLVATEHESTPDYVETTGWRSPLHSPAAWFGSPALRDALCRITRDRWSAANIVAQRMGGQPRRRTDARVQMSLRDRLADSIEQRRREKAQISPDVFLVDLQDSYISYSWDGHSEDGGQYRISAHTRGGIVRGRHWYQGEGWSLVNDLIDGDGDCRDTNRRRLTSDRDMAERIVGYINSLGQVSGKRLRELRSMAIAQLAEEIEG